MLREFQESDLPFVIDSWLNSNMKNKSCQKSIYEKEHRKLINRIIENPNVEVQILCLKDDLTHIIGFICMESDNILHYIYIKAPFRGFKLGKKILANNFPAKIVTTHDTIKFKPNDITIIYNPYLLYRYHL